jgi:hypothetical protein
MVGRRVGFCGDNLVSNLGEAIKTPLKGVSLHDKVDSLNIAKTLHFLEKDRAGGIPLILTSAGFIVGWIMATRFIFAGCCADARGIAVVSIVAARRKSRRLIQSPRWR